MINNNNNLNQKNINNINNNYNKNLVKWKINLMIRLMNNVLKILMNHVYYVKYHLKKEIYNINQYWFNILISINI